MEAFTEDKNKLLEAGDTQSSVCVEGDEKRNCCNFVSKFPSSSVLWTTKAAQQTHCNTNHVQPFTAACTREEAGVAQKVFHTG